MRAAVSQYGVTDLAALAATTHRFESRYLDRLVGVLPRDAARYRERSPSTHAASIRVPVLVLHGRDDRVVPVGQADALVQAIRAAGGTVESHRYDGEGHGWSHPDTVADAYRARRRVPPPPRRRVTGQERAVDYQGPRRGADRAVLLAHGAGADRHAKPLVAVADALAGAGVPSLRFDYPYRAAGRRAPDRPAVLDTVTREAAAELAPPRRAPARASGPRWPVHGRRASCP